MNATRNRKLERRHSRRAVQVGIVRNLSFWYESEIKRRASALARPVCKSSISLCKQRCCLSGCKLVQREIVGMLPMTSGHLSAKFFSHYLFFFGAAELSSPSTTTLFGFLCLGRWTGGRQRVRNVFRDVG